MTRTRAVILLFIIAIAAFLPAIREEVSWLWADSHQSAAEFESYLEDWPNGRHAADARLNYYQRAWVEREKAMIHQAYHEASSSSAESDAEYRKQQRLRRDTFSWKAATNSNTLQSYQNYLRQFPGGQFARPARARINALNQNSQGISPVSSPSAR
jgi:outer membrane protein assembly factor BamD (BamD/ComL family)